MRRRVGIILLLMMGWTAYASAQAVAPYMRLQFLTNAGAPCASCKLNTYGAGTSTQLSTYSNQALSTANDNPIILNSAGRPASDNGVGVEVNVYLSSASYKFVLTTSAGTIIWTADNVVPNASGLILPATYAVGDILYANTTATLARLAAVATGSVLVSGGASTAPAWSATPTVTGLTATSVTTASLSSAPLSTVEGRLTCTTAVPVTTADCTGVTSLYWTPYEGNRIALYDGSSLWNTRTFTEITISVSACTASKPYDVFLYDSSGTVTAEILVWSSTSARATNLTTQNGVPVKTGVTTRRYVGSFYCNSSGGQTDDSLAKRNVWNYYHRKPTPMYVLEATNSWAYTSATFQQANAAATNQLEVMVGWAEDAIEVDVRHQTDGTTVGQNTATSIGEDSTSTPATGASIGGATIYVSGYRIQLSATLRKVPAIGRHLYVWLESGGTNTTFYGDGGVTTIQSGIFGTVMR